MTAGPDPLADRVVLVTALRGAASDLAHIAGRISGAQRVPSIDVLGADETLQRARLALDHFKSRNPA